MGKKAGMGAELLILAGAILAVYGQTGGFGFIQYDDNPHILLNPYLKSLTADSLWALWTQVYQGLYIPVAYTAYFFETLISREPAIYHIANVLFHFGAASAVYAIARLLYPLPGVALLASLLFALHPFQVEPVAWISGQRDVLGASLGLWALYGFLRALDATNLRWYASSLTLFALALLTKPNTLALPFMAVPLVLLYRPEALKRALGFLAPWAAMSLGIAIISKIAQPDRLIDTVVPVYLRPLVAADSLLFYLFHLFVPVGLVIDYARLPTEIVKQPVSYLLTGIVLLGIALLWWQRLRTPALFLAMFTAALLPVLGFVSFSFQNISSVADRYMYLALLGPALGVAFLLSRHHGQLALASVAGLAVLGGLVSHTYTKPWRDEISLYTRAVDINPKSPVAHNNLALALGKIGKTEEAKKHYEKANKLRPLDFTYAMNEGIDLLNRDEVEKALDSFRRALKLDPDEPTTDLRLAKILVRQEKLEAAISLYRKVATNPNAKQWHTQAWDGVGSLHHKLGREAEAIAAFEAILKIEPKNVTAMNNIASSYAFLKRFEDADRYFKAALKMAPDSPDVKLNWASVLDRQQRFREARALYEQVDESTTGNTELLIQWSGHFAEQGKWRQATWALERLLRFHSSAKAWVKLAESYYHSDRKHDAVDALTSGLRMDPQDRDGLVLRDKLFPTQAGE